MGSHTMVVAKKEAKSCKNKSSFEIMIVNYSQNENQTFLLRLLAEGTMKQNQQLTAI